MNRRTLTVPMGVQPLRTARANGFSLVELMVAMVISLLVMLGLVSVMDNVGVVNRAQDGLARLQENGRYAMTRVSQDLRAAAGQHCSNFGVGSSQLGAGGFTYLDRGRAAFAKFYVGGAGAGLVDASGAPFRFGPTSGGPTDARGARAGGTARPTPVCLDVWRLRRTRTGAAGHRRDPGR